MLYSAYAAAAVLAIAAAAPARADDAPSPSEVAIASASLRGSGCRDGSDAVNLSPDRRALTVLFREYNVSSSDGGNPNRRKKSCNLDLRLQLPDGWTFSIFKVDYRGYASLEGGTRAYQESRVSFPPGVPMTRLAALSLAGPYDDNYQHSTEIPLSGRVNAPCGGRTRNLKLWTEIGIETPGDGQALMTVDSADGEVSQVYQLQWVRCR